MALFKVSFPQKSQASSVFQNSLYIPLKVALLQSIQNFPFKILLWIEENLSWPFSSILILISSSPLPLGYLWFCFHSWQLFLPGTWTLLATQKHHNPGSLGLLGWNRLKNPLSLWHRWYLSRALTTSLSVTFSCNLLFQTNQPTLTFPKIGCFLHLSLRTLQFPAHFFQGAHGYWSKLILNSVCNMSLGNLHFSKHKQFADLAFKSLLHSKYIHVCTNLIL